jgi:hypothetical protein
MANRKHIERSRLGTQYGLQSHINSDLFLLTRPHLSKFSQPTIIVLLSGDQAFKIGGCGGLSYSNHNTNIVLNWGKLNVFPQGWRITIIYVRMYIYVYIYIILVYICICVHIYVCIYIYTYMYVCVYMYVLNSCIIYIY